MEVAFLQQKASRRKLLSGGLKESKLTLLSTIEKTHTFEIQSGQEKRAIKGSFSKNGGPGETRTLTPKALDPKSSASTNFATGPQIGF